MQQFRRAPLRAGAGDFPKKEPLTERSGRIMCNLPQNTDLIKPVLVGLLSVEPDGSLYDGMASAASDSLKVKASLFEIAENMMLDEFVRANAARVLGIMSCAHRHNIDRGNGAFGRLLNSDDMYVRFCGAYALLHSSARYMMPKSVGKLAELLGDERFAPTAAKLLFRELSASPELTPKHEPVIDALERLNCLQNCRDGTPHFVLRLKVLGELERLSS